MLRVFPLIPLPIIEAIEKEMDKNISI